VGSQFRIGSNRKFQCRFKFKRYWVRVLARNPSILTIVSCPFFFSPFVRNLGHLRNRESSLETWWVIKWVGYCPLLWLISSLLTAFYFMNCEISTLKCENAACDASYITAVSIKHSCCRTAITFLAIKRTRYSNRTDFTLSIKPSKIPAVLIQSTISSDCETLYTVN
jgi:hypothetical protein